MTEKMPFGHQLLPRLYPAIVHKPSGTTCASDFLWMLVAQVIYHRYFEGLTATEEYDHIEDTELDT